MVSPYTAILVMEPGELSLVPAGANVCVRLGVGNLVAFSRTFQTLRNRSNKFMIEWHDPVYNEAVLELMLHSFFSKNYLTGTRGPVVLLSSYSAAADTATQKELVSTLEHKLRLQGFSSIDWWYQQEGLEPVFMDDKTTINDQWFKTNLFQDLSTLTRPVVLNFQSLAKALSAKLIIDDHCRMFLSTNPGLSFGLESYLAMKHSSAMLMEENARLHDRLAGAEKTINVIRTKYKDDYENLFRWYHNEYEILPLWYKRVGHILKVIKGKRSFRSLFSDDVKKYKD